MIKTGAMDKPKNVLCKDCYTLEQITAKFDQMQINLVTVVSKNRGFKEYQEVLSQCKRKGNLSRYSQSLFHNMFKRW